MPFNILKTYFNKEVLLIQRDRFEDQRGYFEEIFKDSKFKNKLPKFKQSNLSWSKKNVVRGLHYQKNPKAQGKLVYCLKGEIFDVAVDIRKNSPTYKKWIGEIISEENRKMLYIPEGFAHGFCVLKESLVFYKCTNEHAPEYEAGIIWNDSIIKINWPIENPILSNKDLELPSFKKADNNFKYDE